MSFSRSVQTTFQGPLFLSFYLFDEIDCGYNPSSHGYTITYDLKTGEQVDWAKYFTAKPVEPVEVNPNSMLPFSLLAVRSPSLQKSYAAGWQDDEQCHLDDVEDPSGVELTAFLLSPASKKLGLSIMPATDLFRKSAGCAREVVVSKETMNVLGIPDKIQSLLLDGR